MDSDDDDRLAALVRALIAHTDPAERVEDQLRRMVPVHADDLCGENALPRRTPA